MSVRQITKARKLLQDLFQTGSNILRDAENNILRIQVHFDSRPAANKSLQNLFDQLNGPEIFYPGTDMRIIYELGGDA